PRPLADLADALDLERVVGDQVPRGLQPDLDVRLRREEDLDVAGAALETRGFAPAVAEQVRFDAPAVAPHRRLMLDPEPDLAARRLRLERPDAALGFDAP